MNCNLDRLLFWQWRLLERGPGNLLALTSIILRFK